MKKTGECIKCRRCEWVRGRYFCGNIRLTSKQVHNKRGYCSEFIPKDDTTGGEDE